MSRTVHILIVCFAAMILSRNVFSATALIELEPIEKEVSIKSLPRSKDGNVVLNKHDFWVNFFQKEVNGSLTFLPFFGGKTKHLSLLAQKDYVHYRTEGDKRIGVLIRIEAHVQTQQSEVVIKEFHDLGAAAQLGVASGKLYVKVWGLAGAPVFQITTQATLNSASLADIEKQLDDLHKKVYSDSSLTVDPVYLPESIFAYAERNRSSN